MQTSKAGLDLITEFEGLSLEAYNDPGSTTGPWTIGYGSTRGVTEGMKITEKQAMEMLKRDLKDCEHAVLAATAGIKLTQNEFDALVSFVFNIGISAFNKSTVRKMILAGDMVAAGNAFGMWIKNDGKIMKGLIRRRASEKALFLKDEGQPTLNPESRSTPSPSADKPLSRSHGFLSALGLAGTGGIGGIANFMDLSNLTQAQDGIKNLRSETQESPIIFKDYIIQGASFIVFILGIFIMWKRIKDKKDGIK